MTEPEQVSPAGGGESWFRTTHWTVIRNAKADDTVQSREALAKLCETYWPPVHAYILRVGRNSAEAEDLTQQFFARFLGKMHYRLAEPERGRFRSFLLTCVKHFLLNEWERSSAKKRGGGKELLSLDERATETGSPRIEISDERTAERAYEESWAFTLLGHVRKRLEGEYASEGKGARFALLEQFLPGAETELTYAQAARQLGLAEGTMKSDVHRLKARYREVLRDEIAHTVESEAEIDEELRYLVRVLANKSR